MVYSKKRKPKETSSEKRQISTPRSWVANYGSRRQKPRKRKRTKRLERSERRKERNGAARMVGSKH
jgi:hypothetical protein